MDWTRFLVWALWLIALATAGVAIFVLLPWLG